MLRKLKLKKIKKEHTACILSCESSERLNGFIKITKFLWPFEKNLTRKTTQYISVTQNLISIPNVDQSPTGLNCLHND